MGHLHNLFFRYMQLLEQYLYILIECNGGMIASQLVKDGFGPSVLVETLVSPDDKVRCFSLSTQSLLDPFGCLPEGDGVLAGREFLSGIDQAAFDGEIGMERAGGFGFVTVQGVSELLFGFLFIRSLYS